MGSLPQRSITSLVHIPWTLFYPVHKVVFTALKSDSPAFPLWCTLAQWFYVRETGSDPHTYCKLCDAGCRSSAGIREHSGHG
jgi:hypothetical protein